MFAGLNVIHIQRDDILAQGVSFSIAEQTDKWSSLDEGRNVEPQFDPAHIEERIDHIVGENQKINLICRFARLRRVKVTYEDLVVSPQREVDKILTAFGMPQAPINFEEVSLRRQSNEANASFIHKYLEISRDILSINN